MRHVESCLLLCCQCNHPTSCSMWGQHSLFMQCCCAQALSHTHRNSVLEHSELLRCSCRGAFLQIISCLCLCQEAWQQACMFSHCTSGDEAAGVVQPPARSTSLSLLSICACYHWVGAHRAARFAQCDALRCHRCRQPASQLFSVLYAPLAPAYKGVRGFHFQCRQVPASKNIPNFLESSALQKKVLSLAVTMN